MKDVLHSNEVLLWGETQMPQKEQKSVGSGDEQVQSCRAQSQRCDWGLGKESGPAQTLSREKM